MKRKRRRRRGKNKYGKRNNLAIEAPKKFPKFNQWRRIFGAEAKKQINRRE
jgi:hypothetical protein